tara:strand:+ start:1349 stop:1759 length:411 start_codon:yes stop_codon:yes gene_type:complete
MSEINDAARSPWKDDEKLLDVNETTLASRITFLQEQLVKASQALRSEIDPTLSDQKLTEDNTFKQWVVCNSVYDASIKDIQNEGFNRMLYWMFEESGSNIPRLLSNYDVKVDLNDKGELEGIQLVVIETEGVINNG